MPRLVFLGRLADAAGVSEMVLAGAEQQPLAAVLALLPVSLRTAVTAANIRLALNGALVPPGGDVVLNTGDELAFLPPVSGG